MHNLINLSDIKTTQNQLQEIFEERLQNFRRLQSSLEILEQDLQEALSTLKTAKYIFAQLDEV